MYCGRHRSCLGPIGLHGQEWCNSCIMVITLAMHLWCFSLWLTWIPVTPHAYNRPWHMLVSMHDAMVSSQLLHLTSPSGGRQIHPGRAHWKLGIAFTSHPEHASLPGSLGPQSVRQICQCISAADDWSQRLNIMMLGSTRFDEAIASGQIFRQIS